MNGDIINAGFSYTNDQPITGRVRKSTGAPLYKTGTLLGSITTGGFSATVPLITDE